MSQNYDPLVTRLTEYARLHPRMYRARVVGLAMIAAACGGADGGESMPAAIDRFARADSAAVEAVRAVYPRARFEAPAVVPVPGTDYRSGRLRYDTPGDEQAYGTVVALWSPDEGRLAWTHNHRGDFPPGELAWLDADADGRTDLFFISGEENVYETYLYINRIGQGTDADSAFTLGYRSGNDYTTLLDLDRDGSPELIDSGYPGEEHVNVDACTERPPPSAVADEAQREYARRVGPFDQANFKYGYERFGIWTLHMLDPVRILHLRDGGVRDVTRAFPEHLRWRIGVLETYAASATPECRAHLTAVIDHLRRATA